MESEKKIKEVENWLNLAKEDLIVSELLYKNKKYSNSVYHAQQASEKAVKAILILLDEQIYEHKISSFFYDLVYTKFPYDYIEEIYFNLSKLETHWLKSRYILKNKNTIINPLEVYNKKNSKELIEISKKTLELSKKFLKEEFDLEF
jgi:HEPN domain-containing protein